MIKGSLIHADETRLGYTQRLPMSGFCHVREVVYFYSETREELVQSALGEFKGIWYPISTRPTTHSHAPAEVLAHLMRDLNDAVLDNPYDEEVKGIVAAFAELLHGIVQHDRGASKAGSCANIFSM